jgi:hypothetical protein
MVYAASINTDLDSLAEVLIFSYMFSHNLCVPSLSWKFSKAAYLFEILIWYCFLTFRSHSLQRLNQYIKLLCCMFTYCQSFPNFCNHQIMTSIKISPAEISYIEYSNAISFLSICDQSGFESSHQDRSRCTYECFCAVTSCSQKPGFLMWQSLLF